MKLPRIFFAILFASLFLLKAEAAPKPSPVVDNRPATLVGDADKLGWYLAPAMNYTSIRSSDGLLLGAKGGAILDHRLVLGAAGYVYLADAFGTTSGTTTDLAYGGAFVEYIFSPQQLVHFSVSTILGGGSANTDFVLVANPAANVILNITPTVHLGAELAYRFTKILPTNRPNAGIYSGTSFGLFLQFGSF